MSTFDSTREKLKDLLSSITTGKLQLPEFQRDWVWDDAHIRSLLVSIARSFPVGAIMLLEKGGEVRFAERPLEGVSFSGQIPPAETLILDGQQRLTTLTQALVGNGPVRTRDDKNVPINRYYYLDIAKAMEGGSNFVDEAAIVAVDEDHKLRKNFGREVVLDLSTPEFQYAAMHYPFSLVIQSEQSDRWEVGLLAHWQNDMARYQQYLAFRGKVLNAFRYYELPAIKLKKETSREGICLVFEKVNTGGVSLNAFELVTATYAADGYDLRKDWFGDKKANAIGRQGRLFTDHLLKGIEATDFLQAISILDTYERRQADLAGGKDRKQATAISAKKETMLALPLAAYNKWKDSVERGFLEAGKFLRGEQFYSKDLVPYRAQIVPMAALMARLGDEWRMTAINAKLQRWFWCGVFGELYGGASETRIANDFEDLIDWIAGAGGEPRTIVDAGFQPSRLDTMRTRLSAAYKGLQVLLLREGAKDFYYKQTIQQIDKDEANLDIHHVFPRRWCEQHGIPPRRYNSVINKTPISVKANRSIGGKAPSQYLQQIQAHPRVALAPDMMDEILRTHRIQPELLRGDNFEEFIDARRHALLDLIRQVTGNELLPTVNITEPDEDEEEELQQDEQEQNSGTVDTEQRIYDEAYWREKAYWTDDAAKALLGIVGPVLEQPKVKYLKNYVSVVDNGSTYFWLYKRTGGKSILNAWVGEHLLQEAQDMLSAKGMAHRLRKDHVLIPTDEKTLQDNSELFKNLAELVKRAWVM